VIDVYSVFWFSVIMLKTDSMIVMRLIYNDFFIYLTVPRWVPAFFKAASISSIVITDFSHALERWFHQLPFKKLQIFSIALSLQVLLRYETECRGVHAEAQVCWRRSVIKYMAEM